MFVSEAIGLNYINFPHHALPYFIVIITSVKKKKKAEIHPSPQKYNFLHY